MDGVGIENRNRGAAYRAGLEDRSPLTKSVDHRFELRLGNGEWGAFHRRDALRAAGEAEIRRGRDDDARSAVNLLEKLVIHQDAAVFKSEQIRAPASRQPDFQAAAAHFGGCLAYGLIFPD